MFEVGDIVKNNIAKQSYRVLLVTPLGNLVLERWDGKSEWLVAPKGFQKIENQ